MKLMRSRFRLISLLLACVFILTAVLCAASVMKQSGVSLPSVQKVLPASGSPPPEASPADAAETPVPPEPSPDADETPGTDNSPVSEYNLFGL